MPKKMKLIEELPGPFSPRRHEENIGVEFRYFENNSFPQHNVYMSDKGTNSDFFQIEFEGYVYVFEAHSWDCGYFVSVYQWED